MVKRRKFIGVWIGLGVMIAVEAFIIWNAF